METENKYKELKTNTIIIGISNIGSKAIAFILAPLYSYYLSTSQYGQMDLITTTTSLLVPIICLDLFEAAFRFCSDNESNKKMVLSTCLTTCIPSFLILVLVSIVAFIVADSPKLIIYTCIYLILDSINQILQQYLRGTDKLKAFAMSGVINSITLLASNILFLVLLKLELDGWLISYLFGKLAMLLYIAKSCDLKSNYSIKYFSRDLLRELLKYCIPLLPTQIMWWVMNASDRYMLALFIGTSINGIYAVANKLPSLLSIFENIFYQSFQITGVKDAKEKDNELYSKIFNSYLNVLTVGILAILIFLKQLIILLFDNEYSSAWMPSAILLIAVLVHALSGNLGVYYTTSKKTKGALITSSIGAITNIVLNAIFIPKFSIMAAATTTLIGYIVTLFIRWFDVKKIVKIKLNHANALLCTISICIQLILYFIPGILSILLRCAIFAYNLYLNKNIIMRILKR